MTYIYMALFWSLLLAAYFRRGPLLLYLLFGSMSFQTFAVLPPQFTGGLTLTPAPIVALFIVAQRFGSTDGMRRLLTLATRIDRLAILSAFWLVAFYTTIFMPRLFAREIDVIPFRGGDLSMAVPLLPSTQNISQLGYLTISILTVFAFADILRDPQARNSTIKAVIFGGCIVVATGFLDFASQYVPIGPLLDPLRTASYALATEVMVFGGKRVVGLTSEASAFGAVALSFLMFLYFIRRSIGDRRVRDVYLPAILLSLVVLIYLAKSSGAYLGFGLFVVVVIVEGTWRYLRRRGTDRRGVRGEFWSAYLLGMLVLLAIMIEPDVLDPVIQLMDRMVFDKTSSSSYNERGLWRSTAWDALWSSYGAGIGIGSTRSSSDIAGIFSATGLLGGFIYYAFVLQTLTRRARDGDTVGQQLANAVRLAFLPAFTAGYFDGSADFGVFTGFMYGLMAGTAFNPSPFKAADGKLPADGGSTAKWLDAAADRPLRGRQPSF